MQRVALAIVLRDRRILLARRPQGSHLAGLWEFPGGKIEPGEEPAAAALRELREETGLTGGRTEKLTQTSHSYDDRQVELWAYLVTGTRGRPVHHAGQELRWLAPTDLAAVQMPAANQPMLAALSRRLGASRDATS
jgi:8-oxo-dGTP diphosphatase